MLKIIDHDNAPDAPSTIPTTKQFLGAFGHCETEISANWIVQFCTEANEDSWAPFALNTLDEFYRLKRVVIINRDRKHEYDHQCTVSGVRQESPTIVTELDVHPFTFNRLIQPGAAWGATGLHEVGGGWIVEKDGKLHITEEFVARCVRSTQ